MGSTFSINVSYPNYEKFDVLDMGGDIRKYSPIRITMDEVADRGNDGIMSMNDAIEKAIVDSVDAGIKKFSASTSTVQEIASSNSDAGCCN